MSEMDRLEAIDDAVARVGKLARGDRTAHLNKVLGFRLSEEQLKEAWGRELLHRRGLFLTALRTKNLWP